MLFNSYIFIFAFLPLILLLFFSIAQYSRQAALGVLLAGSFIFYGWENPHYLVPLTFSIVTNFFISKKIQESVENKKLFLWLGIIFNLGLLGYFKYTDFLIKNINDLFHFNFALFNITLPLGISFFSFTQIAFLVDSYRGIVTSCRPLNYALFVTYFPHLIAGPIIHHKEVMPQFEKSKTFQFNYRHFVVGMSLFAIGLFKKAVLADYLGALVAPVFDTHLSHIASIDAWVASLAYTFEIYFDFSGYIDMAMGLSLLIGIKLPINFYSPYKSVNIIEFWRRWNMTLSRFLRDYLYIPLGGNRRGPMRRYLNLIITMLLGGLWHGANWTFVVWGLLHGFYLCINHAWLNVKDYFEIKPSNGLFFKLLSGAITFLAVVAAWVFFRAPDFSTAHQILQSMYSPLTSFNLEQAGASAHVVIQQIQTAFASKKAFLGWIITHTHLLLILFAAFIVWRLPNTYELFRKTKIGLLPYATQYFIPKFRFVWKPKWKWNYFTAFILVAGILHINTSSIFLYFQF